MNLDWEHRFEQGYPIYMQVSRHNFVIHLSEHSGDGTPGSKVFVNTDELDNLFEEISSKKIQVQQTRDFNSTLGRQDI